MLVNGVIPLISMPEIAEMAGVKRPVVTTWRRRHPGFPRPAGGDAARPYFDAHEIVTWLTATGRVERQQAEEDLSLYALARLGRELPGRELVSAVTALICLRYLDSDEPLADDALAGLRHRAALVDRQDELLLSEIRAIPKNCAWLAGVVDDLVEAAYSCGRAFERVLGMRHRFAASDLYASAVVPELARLIAAVSGIRERAQDAGSVLVTDFATGPGDLLLAAATLLRDHSPTFTGVEPDPYLVRLTRRRLLVQDIPMVDLDVRVGDGLPGEEKIPDAILTQFPYRPAEDRVAADVLTWVNEISLRLPPGRTAVLLGPANVLTGELKPFSSEERDRVDLLKSRMVEAVIRLPGGVVPFRPGYETALWVLTSAHESEWKGRILLADVSDRPLTKEVVDALIEDIVTWRRDGYQPQAHTRIFATQVNIDDLVRSPRPLTAKPPVGIPSPAAAPAAKVARVTELERLLDSSGVRARTDESPIRSLLAESATGRPPVVTIGKLIRDELLTLRRGARFDPAHFGTGGNYAVLGAPEVLGHRRPGTRKIDLLTLTAHYPRAKLTEPGDVIVTTTPELGAFVDHEGRSVVEFPARILRIADTGHDQFTPRVLATLIAENSSSRVAGSVRLARRLEEHRVVLLLPDLLARLDHLLATLDERRRLAREEIDLLDELAGLAITGLASGTLTLSPAVSQLTSTKETDAPA